MYSLKIVSLSLARQPLEGLDFLKSIPHFFINLTFTFHYYVPVIQSVSSNLDLDIPLELLTPSFDRRATFDGQWSSILIK